MQYSYIVIEHESLHVCALRESNLESIYLSSQDGKNSRSWNKHLTRTGCFELNSLSDLIQTLDFSGEKRLSMMNKAMIFNITRRSGCDGSHSLTHWPTWQIWLQRVRIKFWILYKIYSPANFRFHSFGVE